MSDLFLDLRDIPRVIDFIADAMEYAPAKERSSAEVVVKAYHDGETLKTDRLAEVARRVAIATWPARAAVTAYFDGEGRNEEWKLLLGSVRPSTAHLLQRVRTHSMTVDQALSSSDADIALQNGEEIEIEEVRTHLRQTFWKEHGKKLQKFVQDGEAKIKEYLGKLKTLRDLAFDLPPTLQNELVSKITRYEDRIYFEGEAIPMEILDGEEKYYIEQKEISPLE
jgi:hypothetical protein